MVLSYVKQRCDDAARPLKELPAMLKKPDALPGLINFQEPILAPEKRGLGLINQPILARQPKKRDNKGLINSGDEPESV
jgi:hypothetical protein